MLTWPRSRSQQWSGPLTVSWTQCAPDLPTAELNLLWNLEWPNLKNSSDSWSSETPFNDFFVEDMPCRSETDETELHSNEAHRDQWWDSPHSTMKWCSWPLCGWWTWPSSDLRCWPLHHSQWQADLYEEWQVHEVRITQVHLKWLLYLWVLPMVPEGTEGDCDLWGKETKNKSLWFLPLMLWVEWSDWCWVAFLCYHKRKTSRHQRYARITQTNSSTIKLCNWCVQLLNYFPNNKSRACNDFCSSWPSEDLWVRYFWVLWGHLVKLSWDTGRRSLRASSLRWILLHRE